MKARFCRNYPHLRFLGHFVFQKISENPELLKKDWRELATSLLREAFEFAELDVPKWIKEQFEGVSLEEIDELVNEEIRARLLEDINQRYSKHISRVVVEIEDSSALNSLKWRLEALLQENFISWAFQKGDNIVITNSVLKVLDGLGIDSLKSLAERFGWEYKKVKISGKTPWAIVIPLSEFVAFLEGKEEVDSDEMSSLR